MLTKKERYSRDWDEEELKYTLLAFIGITVLALIGMWILTYGRSWEDGMNFMVSNAVRMRT